ncbi:hypothetical protein KSC_050020 [Ktedonobacter sp. SOSP1-52]|uniref:hypothetical protein n=1 Tax=Ktedonobacter sp. SOSP1-52 TaxID=2778366 RepID=UPI001915DB36|nr:hypothetical protein [Ktedonobacter sp. SOSP1-52]GHO66110.1 hypothetical protein KSC_050020 [Ktedonobacter sp. SOSP1-52]
MNASTSGPHILLFERDQQLAGLLIGELQLAGYDCHTARTAVEVFDAIARLPIRLILVNLAQAATARREFWVALDTQRRGRGIQVLTFNCTNIAGYGPRDFDDHINTTPAEVEVDGMLGVMGLVDAVRARIPSEQANTSSTTQPRLTRTSSPSAPNNSGASPTATPRPTQPVQTPGQSYRTHSSPEQPITPLRSSVSGFHQPAPGTFNNTGQYSSPTSAVTPPQTPNVMEDPAQSSYTDKIHAVLYPNQRTWSAPNTPSQSGTSDNRYEAQSAILSSFANPSSQPSAAPMGGSSLNTLQRLANGQVDAPNESGLAQLSRLIQGRQAPPAENHPTMQPAPERQAFRPIQSTQQAPVSPPPAQYTRSEAPAQARVAYQVSEQPSFAQPIAQPEQDTHVRARPFLGEQGLFARAPQTAHEPSQVTSQAQQTTAYATHPATDVPPRQVSEQLFSQPLRPAPIEGMPAERPTNMPPENPGRRTEAPSRPNSYGQATNIASPLASIVTATSSSQQQQHAATPQATFTGAPGQEYISRAHTAEELKSRPKRQEPETEKYPPTTSITDEKRDEESDIDHQTIVEQIKAEIKRATEGQAEKIAQNSTSNAVLIDIMQSLPPMPTPPPQPPQPQALNGRATRSLGSVLLEGHLVPESRLDVAQNIQRMLNGVDLNYQLGEILLMFKLLTPDQLLAASLVSYGMINTTQIGSLGRIRQELHTMGLEYDLENLLIMFRVLTPEQLREVKADW